MLNSRNTRAFVRSNNRRFFRTKSVIGGSGYTCSTKQIITNWKSQMTSFGYTVGSTKCLAEYINPLTTTSKTDCLTLSWVLAMNRLGYIINDSTCLNTYLRNQITGEGLIQEVAYWDTMDTNWDSIDYMWNEEWYNTL
jgi:hypothetical protein